MRGGVDRTWARIAENASWSDPPNELAFKLADDGKRSNELGGMGDAACGVPLCVALFAWSCLTFKLPSISLKEQSLEVKKENAWQNKAEKEFAFDCEHETSRLK